jgi:predicted small lipoprotein YifL
MLRHFRLAAAACIAFALLGCGIKGPLVLPPRPAPATTPPTSDAQPPDAKAAPALPAAKP